MQLMVLTPLNRIQAKASCRFQPGAFSKSFAWQLGPDNHWSSKLGCILLLQISSTLTVLDRFPEDTLLSPKLAISCLPVAQSCRRLCTLCTMYSSSASVHGDLRSMGKTGVAAIFLSGSSACGSNLHFLGSVALVGEFFHCHGFSLSIFYHITFILF